MSSNPDRDAKPNTRTSTKLRILAAKTRRGLSRRSLPGPVATNSGGSSRALSSDPGSSSFSMGASNHSTANENRTVADTTSTVGAIPSNSLRDKGTSKLGLSRHPVRGPATGGGSHKPQADIESGSVQVGAIASHGLHAQTPNKFGINSRSSLSASKHGSPRRDSTPQSVLTYGNVSVPEANTEANGVQVGAISSHSHHGQTPNKHGLSRNSLLSRSNHGSPSSAPQSVLSYGRLSVPQAEAETTTVPVGAVSHPRPRTLSISKRGLSGGSTSSHDGQVGAVSHPRPRTLAISKRGLSGGSASSHDSQPSSTSRDTTRPGARSMRGLRGLSKNNLSTTKLTSAPSVTSTTDRDDEMGASETSFPCPSLPEEEEIDLGGLAAEEEIDLGDLATERMGQSPHLGADIKTIAPDVNSIGRSQSRSASYDEEIALPPVVPNHAPITGTVNLVEAQPVEEEPVAAAEAEEVDPELLEQIAHKRKERRQCRRIGAAVIFVCCCALALSLGLGLGRNKRKGISSASIPTISPTMAPSNSPSSAPTGAMDLLYGSLPADTLDRLDTFGTTQQKAWDWLSNHPDVAYLPTWRLKQLFALATFFYSFEGPYWPEDVKENWLDYSKSECLWFSSEFGALFQDGSYKEELTYNVQPCNDEGEFQYILLAELSLSNYTPSVPPEISFLTSLSILALPFNGIQAPLDEILPSELFQLEKLSRINLFQNQLTGSIPSELGLLSDSLTDLALAKNSLTGSMPTELGMLSNVERLLLYQTSLNATVPTEIGTMSALTSLQIASNKVTGTIPSEVGLLTNLDTLFLFNNAFSGQVPTEFGLLSNVQRLALLQTDITGTLPSEMGLMTSMSNIYLYVNALTGSVPSQLGLLTNLIDLDISSNLLTGRIPSQLGMLSSVDELHLQSNKFTGFLPSEVGLMANVTICGMDQNQLTGGIPSELGSLSQMTILTMWGNSFDGPVPSEIGLMSSLLRLDLSVNTFEGSIPSEMGLLQNLTSLWLWDNSLTGTIPSTLGLLTSIFNLRLNQNNISGSIPAEVWQLPGLIELDLSDLPNISGSIPFGNMSSQLGYLNFSGTELTGSIPEETCYLQNSSCSFGPPRRPFACSLDFECSDLLCGCGCACSNTTKDTQ